MGSEISHDWKKCGCDECVLIRRLEAKDKEASRDEKGGEVEL